MKHLRLPLPTAFRIAGSRFEARALLHVLEKNLLRDAAFTSSDSGSESSSSIRAFPLPWYPDNLAWQLNLTRTDIRRNEAYFRLHNFLISETATGNISRQEAVSMIPPLCLDVKPHHKVLDMCAAPGSKTAQLIEMLHQNDEAIPSGYIVANDVDNKRCYMMVHQCKRLSSPAFIVTNHDASRYPNLFLNNEDGSKRKLKFDRVLCDVPCSGDGTMRKNADVWTKWATSNGLYLHQIQYQVLRRGLELLEVGGKLVYSTCSLNPIEDECIIHRMLKDAEGSVELLEINLPNLKHCKGLSHWTPCTRDLVSYQKFEEVPERWKTTIRPNMFPPSADEAPKFKLDRCVRVLPHQQDTGGFFIALLTKTKPLPWEKPEEENGQGTSEGVAVTEQAGKPYVRGPPKKLRRIQGYKEDPYLFMTEDHPIWPEIREFYGITEDLDCTNFLRRTETGKIKNIYVTNKNVREFVQGNDGNIKIVNVGVKALARADEKRSNCDFRLCQEGLTTLAPFVKGRRIRLPKQDLEALLYNNDEKAPLLEEFSEETQKQIEGVDRGSLILDVELEVENGGPKCQLELVGWKGAVSLRAYIQKNDKVHFLRLCGADVSKFETNKFEKKEAEDKNGDGEGEGEKGIEEDANGEEGENGGDVKCKTEAEDSVTVMEAS